jgi:hypothetical protein
MAATATAEPLIRTVVEQGLADAAELIQRLYFTECAWHQCRGCGAILPGTDTFFPDHSRCVLCFREG